MITLPNLIEDGQTVFAYCMTTDVFDGIAMSFVANIAGKKASASGEVGFHGTPKALLQLARFEATPLDNDTRYEFAPVKFDGDVVHGILIDLSVPDVERLNEAADRGYSIRGLVMERVISRGLDLIEAQSGRTN